MPEHHHGDPGMHSINDMWRYFGVYHWWSWIILIGLVAAVVFFIQKKQEWKVEVNISIKRSIYLFFFAVLLVGCPLEAHKGKSHDSKDADSKTPNNEIQSKISNEKINEVYVKTVKPIFKKKCFDCHSDHTIYPWYYKVPGIKQLIDKDIREAKEHLDFSNDFPFAGHGTPLEDLDEIKETLEEASMPPWNYQLIHSDSKVITEEKKIILKWIDDSKKAIGKIETKVQKK